MGYSQKHSKPSKKAKTSTSLPATTIVAVYKKKVQEKSQTLSTITLLPHDNVNHYSFGPNFKVNDHTEGYSFSLTDDEILFQKKEIDMHFLFKGCRPINPLPNKRVDYINWLNRIETVKVEV